jgi:hypothetical protein
VVSVNAIRALAGLDCVNSDGFGEAVTVPVAKQTFRAECSTAPAPFERIADPSLAAAAASHYGVAPGKGRDSSGNIVRVETKNPNPEQSARRFS